MKCKKCGAEIAEGSLYCDKCGEDIHIVPEYDAEEFNLVQSISTFFEELGRTDEQSEVTDSTLKCRLNKRIVLFVCIFLVTILIIGAGIFLWCRYSFAFQMKRANAYVVAAEYEKAEAACNRAIVLDEQSVNAKLVLADIYYAQNKFSDYEHLLTAVTEDKSGQTGELLSAYEKLIAFYCEQNRHMDVTLLLSKCTNQDIRNSLKSYIVEAPSADLTEGTYRSVQVLKLDAAAGTTIYYTLDGSQPGISSTVYNMPIILENGKHEIRTICVNETGIPSMTVIYEYDIHIDKLLAPTVFPVSGEYNQPQLIEIEGNIDNIFYTLNGDHPDDTSEVYTSPIAMPVGNSVFKFVRIENGNYSEMVERKYYLELTDAISVSDAVKVVMEYMLDKGKIRDYEGHVDDLGSKLIYNYQYVISLTDKGSFYIINESFVDYDGSVTPTGDEYAVDIYSGKLYGLELDMYYNYELVEIESES